MADNITPAAYAAKLAEKDRKRVEAYSKSLKTHKELTSLPSDLARQQYANWADKIDNFNSVEDLSAGYRQLIASELKEDINKIDLKNEFVDAAMRATDDKGKPVGNQVFIKTLRKSDKWADANKDKVFGVANDILSMFGKR